MKVAILLNRLSGGGAERVGTAWADGLLRYGHQVDVILTHEPETCAQRNFVRLDAKSFPLRIGKLAAMLRRRNYDVVISLMPHWNILSLFAVLAMGKKTKTVISLHSLEAGMAKTHGMTFVIETLLARFVYSAADAVVAVSHAVGAEAKTKYNIRRNKIWVLPNPVLNSVSKINLEKQPRKTSLSLIFAGRLVGQKNPVILLRCAAELMKNNSTRNVRVEFFGAGPLEESLRSEARALGVPSVFHGWSEDWTASCPSDGILVLPSMVEGFGNVLVEAAAKGIPSVASSRAFGVGDAVVPGITGALAAGDQVSDYCEAILQANRLPAFEVSSWLERFTAEYAASSLNRIISTINCQSDPA